MSRGFIGKHTSDGKYVVLVDGGTRKFSIFAWCVDLTEDLSGDVGIIEIAGEIGKGVNIQPGYDGNAAYNDERDGDLYTVPASLGTQHSAGNYWNWAMRPGWQKWKPNYRYGRIHAIKTESDTCHVTLYPLSSRDTPDGSELKINQSFGLNSVPIEYMDCNAAAFAEGDDVIVKFEDNDWKSPKVIGFKSDPKACEWEPWETLLCDNHDWTIAAYNFYPAQLEYFECPTIPNASLAAYHIDMDITDGILNTTITANWTDETSPSQQVWTYIVWGASEEDPAIEATEMVIKVTADINNADVTNANIYIYLQDTDGIWRIFYFAGGVSNCVSFPEFYHCIGDNGGEEQTIVLADYGFTGNIALVRVQAEAFATESSAEGISSYQLDYINFK